MKCFNLAGGFLILVCRPKNNIIDILMIKIEKINNKKKKKKNEKETKRFYKVFVV